MVWCEDLAVTIELVKQMTCGKIDIDSCNTVDIEKNYLLGIDTVKILKKQCFTNACNIVNTDTLRFSYCLGYGVISGFPVEHAFVFDNERNVYFDPTSDAFDLDFETTILVKKYTLGEFIDDVSLNHFYPPDITLLVNKAMRAESKAIMESSNSKVRETSQKQTLPYQSVKKC